MGFHIARALRRATDAVGVPDIQGAARSLRNALLGEPDAKREAGREQATRRSLGAVVADLRERARPAPRPEPTRLPELEPHSFENAAGRRDYRLFVPETRPTGLVLMLHGCLQTPEDFAIGTGMNALAAEHGLVIAWPEQPDAHNPRNCWNWFEPRHQSRGEGEPAILAGLSQELGKRFGVPPSRTFVAGLSAGGAMAAILAESYPEVFAAAGVHSGLACGTAHDARSALAAMRGAPAAARPLSPSEQAPRVIVFQGTADQVVHPMNADRVAARACALSGVRLSREGHTEASERTVARSVARRDDGTPMIELWMVDGAGHAWSGSHGTASFADPTGPDASREMLRFFLAA